MRFDPPQKFGHFDLIEIIGRGGMAEIYRAYDHKTGAELVVKRMLPEVAGDDTNVWMFLDEARTQATFNHPNIVRIFDYGEIEGQFYISMEWVRGRDLARIKNRAKKLNLKVSEDIICYVIVNVLNALDHIHSASDDTGNNLHLVHRDINPANIFLSWEGDVKIGDFGIAKTINLPKVTAEGAFRGTLGYMSPEQIKAEPLDYRSDLYALGCVFYELLTWETPFSGGSDIEVLKRTINSKVTPPGVHNPRIKPQLEQVILKALNSKRSRRYQSARAFSEDILEFLYNQGKDLGNRDIQKVLYKFYRSEIEDEKQFDEVLKQKRLAATHASGYMLRGPDGRPLGPFELNAIKGLIDAGKLAPHEEIQAPGERFRKASEIKEIGEIFAARERARKVPEILSVYSHPGDAPYPYTTAIVVDDDKDTLHRIKNILETNKFRVQAISEPSQAIAIAAQTPPAVIISNIIMREMNGYQLLQRLAQNPVTASVPLILLTAREEMRRGLKGFRFGAVDYIAKPFTDTDFYPQVAAILEKLVFREGNYFGTFEKTSIPEINRTLLYEAKTGLLTINAENERGQIVYKYGLAALPYLGPRTGKEAYSNIAESKKGEFRFFEIDPFRTDFIISQDSYIESESAVSEDEDARFTFIPSPQITASDLFNDRVAHRRSIAVIGDFDGFESSPLFENIPAPKVSKFPFKEADKALEENFFALFAIITSPRSGAWEGAWRVRTNRFTNERPIFFVMASQAAFMDKIQAKKIADETVKRLLLLTTPLVRVEQQLASSSLMPLYGRLEYIGLNNFLTLLSEGTHTGVLRVRSIWGEGEIACHEGKFYFANIKTEEGVDGLNAIIEMLDWYQADFCFLPMARTPKNNIEVRNLQRMLAKAGAEVNERYKRSQVRGIASAKSIVINPRRPEGLLRNPPPLIQKIMGMISSGINPSQILTSGEGTQVELLNILSSLAAKEIISVVNE